MRRRRKQNHDMDSKGGKDNEIVKDGKQNHEMEAKDGKQNHEMDAKDGNI